MMKYVFTILTILILTAQAQAQGQWSLPKSSEPTYLDTWFEAVETNKPFLLIMGASRSDLNLPNWLTYRAASCEGISSGILIFTNGHRIADLPITATIQDIQTATQQTLATTKITAPIYYQGQAQSVRQNQPQVYQSIQPQYQYKYASTGACNGCTTGTCTNGSCSHAMNPVTYSASPISYSASPISYSANQVGSCASGNCAPQVSILRFR